MALFAVNHNILGPSPSTCALELRLIDNFTAFPTGAILMPQSIFPGPRYGRDYQRSLCTSDSGLGNHHLLLYTELSTLGNVMVRTVS